ncbi:MAG: WS/DGAT domain-containing protein [Gammaproteobacteria bacterium]|nr:WS/DGAT domain-containing protein [Gammaproteobacteria bacterium]
MEQMSGMDASSYNGNIAITANSCRDMMPHPEFFAQCLQDSYDELKTAAIGG